MAKGRISGITIELNGESKKLEAALKDVNDSLKNTQSNLNDVNKLLKLSPDSTELLGQKQKYLAKQIEDTEEKLKREKEALEQLGQADQTDEIVNQQERLEREIVDTESKLKGLREELNDNRTAYEKLSDTIGDQESELKKLKSQYQNLVIEEKDATDEAQDLKKQIEKLSGELDDNRKTLKQASDAADEFDSTLDDVGDTADDVGDDFSNLKDIIAGNVFAEAISSLVSGMKDLHEQSIEYRTVMASLETSSERAGYSAKETQESYEKLIGVLGDTQTASTTVANMQAIGYSQDELQEAIDGVIGAWATYGDSIPIDSLAESVNETINTSTVTGTFADVLNWAGESEDDFNAKLQKANSNTERANIVLKQLAKQGLVEAGKAWQENNESLVEYNQAQDDFNEAISELGEAAEPVLTKLSQGLTGVLQGINWLGSNVVNAFNGNMDKLEDSFNNLTESEQSHAKALVEQQDVIEGTTEWYEAWFDAIDQVTGKASDQEAALERQNLGTQQLNDTTQYYLDTVLEQIDTLDQSDAKYAESVNAVSSLTTAHQENTAAIQEAIDAVDAKMEELKAQYQSAKESAESSLSSQYSMFSELDTQVDTSVAKVQENLAAQQEFFNAYADNLQSAMDRGVSQGMLEKLSDGSAESAAILAEMKNLTDPELDAFVASFDKTETAKEKVAGLTADIETNFTETMGQLRTQAAQLDADMKSENGLYAAGVSYVQGFINGTNDSLGNIEGICQEMGNLANTTAADVLGVHSPSTITKGYGKNYSEGLKIGINNGKSGAVSAARSLATATNTAVKSNISASEMAGVGRNVAAGLASGISAGQSQAISAAARMAAQALAAAKKELDIHSPSKAFAELGEFSSEGFAIGFERSDIAGQIEDSMKSVLEGAAAVLQKSNVMLAADTDSTYSSVYSAIKAGMKNMTDNSGEYLKAINSMANRPIVTQTYLDGKTVGYGVADYVTTAQNQTSKIKNWIKGNKA